MENTTKNTNQKILEQIREIESILIEKNTAYGDSATNPSSVFSKESPKKSICARIDDKLNRIKNRGINDHTEDTITDLIGYLILLKIVLKDEREQYVGEKNNVIQKSDGHNEANSGNTWTSSSTNSSTQRTFFSDY